MRDSGIPRNTKWPTTGDWHTLSYNVHGGNKAPSFTGNRH